MNCILTFRFHSASARFLLFFFSAFPQCKASNFFSRFFFLLFLLLFDDDDDDDVVGRNRNNEIHLCDNVPLLHARPWFGFYRSKRGESVCDCHLNNNNASVRWLAVYCKVK